MERKYIMPNTIRGTEIKELSESLNLTQVAFATLCNVSVNTVEQREVKIGPIKGTICSFVQALKVKRSLSE